MDLLPPLSNLQETDANLPQSTGQKKNNIIRLQEKRRKDQFLQAIHVLHTQYGMFGAFTPNNVNADGSATFIRKNLLPDRAIVTHEITCQGRDHIVNVRAGESVLVIVNVHFEPGIEGSARRTTPYFSSLATLV